MGGVEAAVVQRALSSGNCAIIQEVLECFQTNISDPKQVNWLNELALFYLEESRAAHKTTAVYIRVLVNHFPQRILPSKTWVLVLMVPQCRSRTLSPPDVLQKNYVTMLPIRKAYHFV